MRLRRLLPFIATTALILAIVYIFRTQISLSNIAQRIAGANLRLVAVAALFFFLGTLGSIVRYKWIIGRALDINAPLFGLFTLTNFSFACGYFAPLSVATEVLRIGLTKRLLSISYIKSLKLAILDRLFGLAGVITCTALFIPLKFAGGFNPAFLIAEALAFVTFFGCCAAFVAGGTGAFWLLRRIPLSSKLGEALISERKVFLERFSDPRSMAIPLICTFLAVGSFGLGTLFVAAAMNFNGSLLTIFLAAPTIMLVQSAPFFYAGFGAREATLLLALPKVAATDANLLISLSVITGVIALLVSLPGAIIFLFETIRNVTIDQSKPQNN